MNIKSTKRKIITYSIIINLLIFAFGYFLRNQDFVNNVLGTINFANFALSVFFGTIISIFRINLIENTMTRSIDLGNDGAKNFARIQYLIRYFLTGVAIFVSAISPFLDLITTFICIATLQPASYLVGLSLKNDDIEKELLKKEKKPSIWDEMK